MDTVIRRDDYLNALITRKNNHLIKVITGIRKSGKSFCLNTLFKNHLLETGVPQDHIIRMDFDLYENKEYQNPAIFYPWIREQIKDDGQYFILLDEVQLLDEFVSILNSLADKKNCDVYVTGSNAKLLSKDISTELGGHTDQIHMYPLSFSEFMSYYPGNKYAGYNEYAFYGGLPLVVLQEDAKSKEVLLKEMIEETYLSDILGRNQLRKGSDMEDLLNILSSTIGNITDAKKLERSFRTIKNATISNVTVSKYLTILEDAFLIESAKTYDIKGKRYMKIPAKYYFMDMGLRNAQINFRKTREVSHSMENVIYNELCMRGYKVDIGNVPVTELNRNKKPVKKQLEVDFIATKGS